MLPMERAVPVRDISPLVHIGFHKTASTLLQRQLFARPEFGFERPHDDRVRIQRDFIRYGPFDDMPAATIEDYREQAHEAALNGRTLVISHERLSGYPGSGSFDARLVADRVKTCLPHARILICVREQADMLYSYYLQYLTDGGHCTFPRLVAGNQRTMYRKPEFDLDVFAYVKTIAYYRRLFGEENVLVVPYEALSSDPRAVVSDVVAFAGQDPSRVPGDIFRVAANPGFPITMQVVRRQLNGLINRNQLAPHAPIRFGPFKRWFARLRRIFALTQAFDAPLRRRLRKQIARAIGDRYVESNARLQAMTTYDLRALGYRMPGATRLEIGQRPVSIVPQAARGAAQGKRAEVAMSLPLMPGAGANG